MTTTAKKTIAKKRVKMKISAKAPVAFVDVPAPQPAPWVTDQGPKDISTMDQSSGLSGMPTLAGQK